MISDAEIIIINYYLTVQFTFFILWVLSLHGGDEKAVPISLCVSFSAFFVDNTEVPPQQGYCLPAGEEGRCPRSFCYIVRGSYKKLPILC